ncbi:MAG: 50S ribosomal protein L10 [Dehalococcoidia bacterium]|nr:50S ribosomal protein L10 [Dehalococcoidia bacterium]
MPQEKKVEEVKELEEFLSGNSVIITTSYQGIKANDITGLRKTLRESGIEFRVFKNTLAKIAAQRANREGLHSVITGPTAFMAGKGDPSISAKVLTDFIRTSRLPITIYGGVLGARVMNAADVTSLAALPSKEVLIGQVLGGLQTPLYGLAGVLNNVLASIARVLEARRQQLEQSS